VLQFKFDEAGWNKVINLMKFIPNYPTPTASRTPSSTSTRKNSRPTSPRARAGESSMKLKDRPRATGEAARVVWKTYEVSAQPRFRDCHARGQVQHQ